MHRDDAVVAALFRETHEILRPLSREDFASYLAREHQTGRTVDLNVLPGTLDKAAAFRFMRNMPLVARLKHPGIQPLAGFGAMGDAHYWAIEHFDGPSMATILQRGPRDVRETLTFAATVCEALHYAHEQQVAHRTLTPASICVTDDRTVIVDFSAWTAVETGPGAGMLVGNPTWMAPELITGAVVTGAADQHALAAIVFAMLTGRPPFRDVGAPATILAILQGPRPKPSSFRKVSPEIDAVVMRGMAASPKDRFPTARDFGAALRAAADTVED